MSSNGSQWLQIDWGRAALWESAGVTFHFLGSLRKVKLTSSSKLMITLTMADVYSYDSHDVSMWKNLCHKPYPWLHKIWASTPQRQSRPWNGVEFLYVILPVGISGINPYTIINRLIKPSAIWLKIMGLSTSNSSNPTFHHGILFNITLYRIPPCASRIYSKSFWRLYWVVQDKL